MKFLRNIGGNYFPTNINFEQWVISKQNWWKIEWTNRLQAVNSSNSRAPGLHQTHHSIQNYWIFRFDFNVYKYFDFFIGTFDQLHIVPLICSFLSKEGEWSIWLLQKIVAWYSFTSIFLQFSVLDWNNQERLK